MACSTRMVSCTNVVALQLGTIDAYTAHTSERADLARCFLWGLAGGARLLDRGAVCTGAELHQRAGSGIVVLQWRCLDSVFPPLRG